MVITFYNSKGGVGKTTSTMHIGAALASMGHNVLVIDFDNQKSLSKILKVEDTPYTVLDLINNTGKPQLRKRSDDYSVLTGDGSLHASTLKRNSLQKSLKSWKSHFDYILIDCRPDPIHKNYLSLPEVAINASDYFVIPVTPHEDVVSSALCVIDEIFDVVKPNHPKIKFIGFFFNIVDDRKSAINRKNFDRIKSEAPQHVFKSYIHSDRQVEYAVSKAKTIFQVAPNSKSALDYIEVTKELLKRI